MSDHIEHACMRCGSLLHHEDAGSCDRRFYVSELGMVRDDLAASRRESAALGAMVARLREALTEIEPLHDSMVHGDECRAHNEGDCDTSCTDPCATLDDCECCLGSSIIARAALALTPATVGAYLTALESTEGIARRIWRADVRDAPQSTTDMEMEELESALAKVDAARALLSDRAPGKDESK